MTDWTPAAIKALRKKLGISQEAAARRIKVAANTWARWEGGSRRPNDYAKDVKLPRLAAIADEADRLVPDPPV